MHRISARRLALASLLVFSAGSRAAPLSQTPTAAQDKIPAEARAILDKAGMRIDLAAGVLALPAKVQIKHDLLEYVLVGANGAGHESLFLTTVQPSLVNTALLLFDVKPGKNATWEMDPGGDPAQRKLHPPEGDGFYLYAAWREAGETYFFRVEDLLRNLETGRTLRRHRWVYLGSRFAALRPGASESFLADLEGNLINLAFFFQGNTLLTAAPEECFAQTIWAANEWLLPESGEPVQLLFARAPLATLPPGWEASLPEVSLTPAPEEDEAPK
jgi:hypothetical protein